MGDSSRTHVGRVFNLVGRFVCIGCLVWFGLLVARVVNADMTTDTVSKEEAVTNDTNMFGIKPGYWRFEGSGLSFERSVQKDVGDLTSLSQSELSDSTADASSILELAKSIGAGRVVGPKNSVLTANTPNIRMRVVTSNGSPPMLLSAVISSKRVDGVWETVELRPRSVGDTDCHLLPLPDDSRQACSRVSPEGRLQMELFTTAASDKQLLDTWRDDGWDIQRAPWGTQEAFAYLCSRDGVVVYAWSGDSVPGGVRAPDTEWTLESMPTESNALPLTQFANRRTVMLTRLSHETGANK